MRLSLSELWNDAMITLRSQREILLALGGVFFLLPPLLMAILAPFQSEAKTWSALITDFQLYVSSNFPGLLLATLVTTFGQLSLLILLLSDRRPTVAEAFRAALPRLPLFVVLVLLVNLMLMGGAILFVIPAFYLYGRTMLAAPAFAAGDRTGPPGAITRSFELTKGNGWRLFAVAALIYLGGQIVASALGSVVGSLAALGGGRELALFAGALVESIFAAVSSMLVLLIAIAAYRQLSARQPLHQ